MKFLMKSIFYLFIISPIMLFSQDTTTYRVSRIEISSLSNLLFFPLESRPQIFLSTNIYFSHKHNDYGITYSRNLIPGRFDEHIYNNFYGVDSGGGFLEQGIRFSYRRVLFERGKVAYNSKLSLNIGLTYLWGKVPYTYLRSPGRSLYAVREKGLILGSGISWYKRITGPVWFTSVMDGGIRFVSMKKNKMSLADSRKFFNYYMGAGLAFRF